LGNREAMAGVITLRLREKPHVPLEAEVICPDVLVGKSREEIQALPVFLGKRTRRLGDFFDVEVDGDGEEIHLEGDLRRVRWVGRGMTRGRIVIRGDVGMHLGAFMQGGTIEVFGNAADWVGAEMTGGRIYVHGDAGGQVGAAYRGSPFGMQGGAILIEGSAGPEVGMRMRRGLIAVGGSVGDFAGLHMRGGTIFLFGPVGIRAGAWMVRGTIVAFRPITLLPTFLYACAYRPVFLRLYFRYLQDHGFPVPPEVLSGTYQRYTGDTAVPGRGEVLQWIGDP
jgi:formylmethanofuran dehydrogenase subunit C